MKKLTKFFLLALCTWFSVLALSFAQNIWDDESISYSPSVYSGWKCSSFQCGINLLWFFTQKFLIWIWIILWIMLIILTVKIVSLHRKIKDNSKNVFLSYIPILNLFFIPKSHIRKVFCLIVMLWFFGYSLYHDINANGCCFDNPSRQSYAWVIVWILAIIVLKLLSSKLSHLIKPDNIDKESPNE